MNDSSLDHFLGAKPTSPQRRAFSLGLLALATVVAGALFVRFLVGSDVPYYTALAVRDDFSPVLTARGQLGGQNEVTVSAAQDGVIGMVAAPGDGAVRQGQLLAAFDPAPLAQAVRADRAALDRARAALGVAQIAATELASRLDRYETVWHRSRGRVPSLNELENARAAAGEADVNVAAARSARDQARRQLATSLAQQAGAAVLAPASGFVTARLVKPGQYVRFDQPLFTVAPSLAGLQLTVPIDPAQGGLLAPRAKARVLVDGLADRIRTATLAAILPAVAGSAAQQAVFTLDQPENTARPGMSATIETELPRRENVLLVPDAALAFAPGTRAPHRCGCIYVLSPDNTPRRVAIATGASDGSRTEVLSGEIEPGAKIIIGWRGGPAARQ